MRKQIERNQFWTALILAFFVLAFSCQDVLAQRKKSTSRKRATTTKQTQPRQNEQQSEPQNVSSENKTSTPNETEQPNSSSSDENSASLKETLDWMINKLSSNEVKFKLKINSDEKLLVYAQGQAPAGVQFYTMGDGSKFVVGNQKELTIAYLFYKSWQETDNCIIKWKETHITANLVRADFVGEKIVTLLGEQSERYIIDVNLKDLDPLSVQLTNGNWMNINSDDNTNSAYVLLKTTDNRKSIIKTFNSCTSTNAAGKQTEVQCPTSSSDDKSYIQFGEKELANRFIKALTHAIKLCGGKVEPF